MTQKIIITDDHQLIANAMADYINGFDGFEVLHQAINGKELLEYLEKNKNNKPDIILLDISMPVMDGFETAKHLYELYPEIKIMALTMQADDDSIIGMIKNGASGYLQKNCSPIEFEKALNILVKEGTFFPSWINNKLFLKAAQNNPIPKIKLSDRENEVLSYMATELSYKQIGEKLFISSRTVETYRDNLFEKLGCNSRIGLVIFAVKEKLITL